MLLNITLAIFCLLAPFIVLVVLYASRNIPHCPGYIWKMIAAEARNYLYFRTTTTSKIIKHYLAFCAYLFSIAFGLLFMFMSFVTGLLLLLKST